MNKLLSLGVVLIALVFLAPAMQASQPTVGIKTRHGQSWRGTIDGLAVLTTPRITATLA